MTRKTPLIAAAAAAAALGTTAGPASAAFTASVRSGTLTITGDAASDALALRLQAGVPTTLQVDVGADGTADFSFDRSRFTAIAVDAGAGNDVLSVNHINGTFTDEAITLAGGSGADTIFGGVGADTILAGKGDDVVTGGAGADRVSLGDGNDRFTWNPSDESDVVEGQVGNDRLQFNGNGANEAIAIAASGSRVRLTRDVASVVVDLGGVERIGFSAGGGIDAATVGNLAGTQARSVDVDLGGDDGQADTVTARGTNGADSVGVSTTAGAVVVSGLATALQVSGSEAALDGVRVATLEGADTITTGIGVSGPATIDIDGGDGADVTQFSGSAAADAISLVANGAEVSTVAPGTSRVDTIGVESTRVAGLAGPDTITAVGNLAALSAITFDGNDGDDTLIGSNGPDLLLGGLGNDHVDGQQGPDRVLLGRGDDRAQWDPGDGNDVVEGEADSDVLDFNGLGNAEAIALEAIGKRARIRRDLGNITLDLGGLETVAIRAFEGADVITVGDLAGTGISGVDVDLATFSGAGDGAADVVDVLGTGARDVVAVARSGRRVVVSGLAAQTRIDGGESSVDALRVHTLAGDDEVTVDPSVSELISPVVDLGDGE